MNPTNFPESNKVLTKPRGTSDEECKSLHVWTDGQYCVSRWEPTWKEWLQILFGKPVWLVVWSGETQPPVLVSVNKPVQRVGGEGK